MKANESFDEIIGRLEANDADAAREIFDRFSSKLIGVARTKLTNRIRQKVDPEDIAQSVFRSFFRRHQDGQFQLEGWNSLWGLLVIITLRKCGRQVATFNAASRSLCREQPIDNANYTLESVTREPSPEEVATITEIVENLMSKLEDRQRTILAMRLQGFTVEVISKNINRSERTVNRLLNRVRSWLDDIAGA